MLHTNYLCSVGRGGGRGRGRGSPWASLVGNICGIFFVFWCPHNIYLLIGQPSDVAVNTIQSQRPELQVVVVSVGSMVTMDMRPNRVRVWVDANNIVARPPNVG